MLFLAPGWFPGLEFLLGKTCSFTKEVGGTRAAPSDQPGPPNMQKMTKTQKNKGKCRKVVYVMQKCLFSVDFALLRVLVCIAVGYFSVILCGFSALSSSSAFYPYRDVGALQRPNDFH